MKIFLENYVKLLYTVLMKGSMFIFLPKLKPAFIRKLLISNLLNVRPGYNNK